MNRAMEIGWAILKNYEPMAHFETAKPLQADRNPQNPSSGKFDPTMGRAKRPLDPQSKSKAGMRYFGRKVGHDRPYVSGDKDAPPNVSGE